VRTILIIKLPFLYKNTGFNRKGLYINISKIKTYLTISDDCCVRLTQLFNESRFKAAINKPFKFRISKYNLAVNYQKMLDEGVVKNKAELARLGGVSRAWITKLMNGLKEVKKV
jgi:hypothetical protein